MTAPFTTHSSVSPTAATGLALPSDTSETKDWISLCPVIQEVIEIYKKEMVFADLLSTSAASTGLTKLFLCSG